MTVRFLQKFIESKVTFNKAAKPCRETTRSLAKKKTWHSLVIRPLKSDEWPLYKRAQVEFYKAEKLWEELQLVRRMRGREARDSITEQNQQIFGVFDNNEFCGIGQIVKSESGRSAQICDVWLDPSVRGRAISDKLVDTMIKWAQKDKSIKKVTTSHRVGNVASKAAILRAGFHYSHDAVELGLFTEQVTKTKVYDMQVKR